MHARSDLRFALVEDAAALLKMLPAPESIVWPSDPGDLVAVDEALAWLSAWLPAAKASRRRHRREAKQNAAVARQTMAAANATRPRQTGGQ